ncbi:MAG: tRNA (adenosine(37)-N6)-threonylcarbamoyltransferase complex dimerization subunit type 1 TsaB [Candidatus Melainabacteria bacterium]|nr:tRNA (adenosine(37)-N6)-threonylcarbamoyltransferase complex dimerization subunit type 1 TsaB [Candidatus Melainabacteria bacterium]
MTPLLLTVDTCGNRLMLALFSGETCLAQVDLPVDSQRTHSAWLIPQVSAVLASQGLQPTQLTDVAVNVGPGSFTGIRAGLSAVRTLGQFLPVRLHAFDTFQMLATQHNPPSASAASIASVETAPPREEARLTLLLNARRNQAYYCQMVLQEQQWQYHKPPQLALLTTLEEQAEDLFQNNPVLIEAPLYDWFVERLGSVETFRSLPVFTAQTPTHSGFLMKALLTLAPQAYQVAWQDLLPCYIQPPSVTWAKPRLPTVDWSPL